MEALISLRNDEGKLFYEFTLPYESVNRAEIESHLNSQYGLRDGYEISYVDEDGDEIAVEFDDDYEVAKLTHQKASLSLNVKITNSEWIDSFKGRKEEEKPKSEQKVQPSLLEPLIQHNIDDIQEETQVSLGPVKLQEEILIKPNEQEETQTLLQSHIPVQSKRTETQTSELQSVEEIPQAKPPKKKPALDFIEDRIPFVEEESEDEKPEVLEPKISEKPKEKKKKQKISKPQKKPKGLNEKEIKKLVKKEVFKLLPQIAQKIKFMEQVDGSDSEEISEKITQQKLNSSLNLSHCTVCSEVLSIPFYVNSSEGIRMCAKCEETDCSNIPIVKIRDQNMLEKLSWAQPLSISTKGNEETDSVRHFTEMKKEFIDSIKKQFDSMIKKAKDESKKEKKDKVKNQKKEKKDSKDELLI